MSKNDYREKIEEHRQSIEVEENNSKASRSRRNNSKKKSYKKTRRNPLMGILTVIFIFIPLMILIYVWGFYSPDNKEVALVDEDDNNTVVQLETNNSVSAEEKVDEVSTEKKEDEQEKENQAKLDAAREEEAKQQALKDAEKLAALEKEKAEKAKQQEQKVHTVQSNENLYRIALKYYPNDANGVQKIMSANNLSSESIVVGQALLIP